MADPWRNTSFHIVQIGGCGAFCGPSGSKPDVLAFVSHFTFTSHMRKSGESGSLILEPFQLTADETGRCQRPCHDGLPSLRALDPRVVLLNGCLPSVDVDRQAHHAPLMYKFHDRTFHALEWSVNDADLVAGVASERRCTLN